MRRRQRFVILDDPPARAEPFADPKRLLRWYHNCPHPHDTVLPRRPPHPIRHRINRTLHRITHRYRH